jgi:hypothetical protein
MYDLDSDGELSLPEIERMILELYGKMPIKFSVPDVRNASIQSLMLSPITPKEHHKISKVVSDKGVILPIQSKTKNRTKENDG